MRRNKADKKQRMPEVIYNSELLARLINMVMSKGKKSVAEKIVYNCLDIIKNQNKELN